VPFLLTLWAESLLRDCNDIIDTIRWLQTGVEKWHWQCVAHRRGEHLDPRPANPVPSFHGGNNFVMIIYLSEQSWVGVGLGEEAVDRGLKSDDRAKRTLFSRRLVSLAKRALTAFSHEAQVGVPSLFSES
jgi:hypothetical protein